MPERKNRTELLGYLDQQLRSAVAGMVAVNQLAARRAGLHPTDLLCLCLLETHGPQSAGQLGKLLGQSSAAVTATVDRVERLGYVRRVADPHDRRRVILEPDLERIGREVTGPVTNLKPAGDTALLSGLTNADLQVIADFLGRLAGASAQAIIAGS